LASARDRAMIVKVARMYYEQEMSQDQIARAMLTSRSNVSRMLTVAKKIGIVEIRVADEAKRDTHLEEMLQSRFGLRAAVVASISEPSREAKLVGQLAATHFLTHLKPRAKVAISWGRSMEAMVQAVENHERRDLTLVPLMGGMTSAPNSLNGETLIRALAEALSADFQVLHAPTIVQSPEVKTALLQEPSISLVIEAARQADVAFVGIGSKESSSANYVLESAGMTEAHHPEFWAKFEGDVSGRFFDSNGQAIDSRLDARTIGIDLEDLRKIRNVVGVAFGADKAPGILGALRGRLITELVTSQECAKRILGIERDGES
jgi:DNA-binding transcriptional regulator LsrR (DeoR family)